MFLEHYTLQLEVFLEHYTLQLEVFLEHYTLQIEVFLEYYTVQLHVFLIILFIHILFLAGLFYFETASNQSTKHARHSANATVLAALKRQYSHDTVL